ncbi:DNA-binding protein [Paraburkholderia dioscoreae]|uniref:DNA-binding protein n=1 Tax=Paraburkholderia dioscoreae TaxID=2604047 RepID=A0A5Q4ZMJ7_9BURK|nr:DNA-binding protein [Paraburkholderia dioscoreae]VVD29176.1 DNA-binding protein [Paraburkholderia dioscoreae]
METSEVVFKSAFDAVRFALCYSSQQYGETLMAKRLRGDSTSQGMGLVGLDGAGQAGQIRREMWEMPDLHLAALVARAAPHDVPCCCGAQCCSGHRPNQEWRAAIAWLTDASTAYVSGFSHYQVRRAIVERIFGSKEDLQDIAERCGAHRNTVGNHNTAVRRWLEGGKKSGEVGVTQVAWSAIERRFSDLGLLRTEAAA